MRYREEGEKTKKAVEQTDNIIAGKQVCTHFNVDVVGKVFELVRSRQSAEFPVVVVRSETVVTASLHVDSPQVPTERTSGSEQEIGDLYVEKNTLVSA